MKKDDLKRLLAGFFLVMLLLSVLSRAAASVTVPRVMAQGVKQGALTYKLFGTGTVVEEKTRAIPVVGGLRIEEVFAKAGQQVEKGEVLFSYSMESIEEALKEQEKELKQLNLSYEQEQAGGTAGNGQEKGAKLSVEQAQHAYEQSKEALEQAELDTQLAIEKEEEEKRKKIEDEIAAIEEEYNAMQEDWEEKRLAATRAIEDAKAAYDAQRADSDTLDGLLFVYRQAVEKKDGTEIAKRRQELVELYFGDGYKSYQSRKRRAERAVSNAKEDLSDIRAKWRALINEEDKESEEPEVVENYRAQCRNRDSEVKAAQRAVESAEADLAEETREETALTEAMWQYERGEATGYQSLCKLLVKKLGIDEAAIQKAKTEWERAEESLKRLEDKTIRELAKLAEKKLAAEERLDAVEVDSGDYEKDIKAKEEAIQNAEYALRQAQNEEESTKDSIAQAAKSKALRLQSIAVDIEAKKQQAELFRKLQGEKGKVKAPADGTVAEQELRAGSLASGQERVILAADLCSFQATVEAKSCERFEAGDEITLSREGSSKTLSISSFSMEDKEGMRILTVDLPKEGYPLGSSWNFQAEKNSVSYDQKLPLVALRNDNGSYFVLVVEERAGILGTEEYLSRMGVELLAKDDDFAAVSGSLGREMKILVSSSRNVEAGDRVRLVEE